jgi:hypothetical protein
MSSCVTGQDKHLTKSSISFDKEAWINDTLGFNGYRQSVVSGEASVLLSESDLKEKQESEIINILGVPDFICESKNEVTYQYCIESSSIDNYKPKQPCSLNKGMGSLFVVVLKNGYVEATLVLNRGG